MLGVVKNLNRLERLWKTFKLLLSKLMAIDFYAVADPVYPNHPVNVGITRKKKKSEQHMTQIWLLYYSTNAYILLAFPSWDFDVVCYEEVRCIKFSGRTFSCHYGTGWNTQRFSLYKTLVHFPINNLYILFKNSQMVLGSRKEK